MPFSFYLHLPFGDFKLRYICSAPLTTASRKLLLSAPSMSQSLPGHTRQRPMMQLALPCRVIISGLPGCSFFLHLSSP